jgi:hypothetical protein
VAVLILAILLLCFSAAFTIVVLAVCLSRKRTPRPRHSFRASETNLSVQQKLPGTESSIRYALPTGPEGTIPSNMSYFFFRGKHYLIVRYVFYSLDKASLAN